MSKCDLISDEGSSTEQNSSDNLLVENGCWLACGASEAGRGDWDERDG
jgi:hypothetical protein